MSMDIFIDDHQLAPFKSCAKRHHPLCGWPVAWRYPGYRSRRRTCPQYLHEWVVHTIPKSPNDRFMASGFPQTSFIIILNCDDVFIDFCKHQNNYILYTLQSYKSYNICSIYFNMLHIIYAQRLNKVLWFWTNRCPQTAMFPEGLGLVSCTEVEQSNCVLKQMRSPWMDSCPVIKKVLLYQAFSVQPTMQTLQYFAICR